MLFSRRTLLGAGAATALTAGTPALAKAAPKRFEATWQSLAANYQAPDWFRDVKFGIWAHWGPQGVGQAGDWYARKMYIQGDPYYDRHLKDYGHPSKTGYIDMIGKWTAEKWQPDQLLDLYQKAGAKYFMALAGHHDNFDTFASKHHEWNATRLGPKKDVVGEWAKRVRERKMPFGVSNHVSHAWHWFQPAYGYDQEGPLKGVRYDAYNLTKADGKGKDWDGLDPQVLYTGRNMVMPDGIDSIAAAKDWHLKNDRVWTEDAPAINPAFTASWKARALDLIDTYKPDLLYYDNVKSLPLGQAGLDVTAHFYNESMKWHKGALEVVATCKQLPPEFAHATVDDVERGFMTDIAERPWQTDTCIGDWFYDKNIFAKHRYKTAQSVIHRLADVVSKNGTLMLNIPMRPDGTIDEDEYAILTEIGEWIAVNGEAIYSTRPWRVYGEGPTKPEAGMMNEKNARPFTAQDVRYTTKGKTLYAIVLGIPENRQVRLSEAGKEKVALVTLLGEATPLDFRQDAGVLVVSLPSTIRSKNALTLKLVTS